MQHILAIDQGTTSSRAMIFTEAGHCVASVQHEFSQYYPQDGWVEHDANEIWQTSLACCQQVLTKAKLTAAAIKAVGISNQRETTVIWDRNTGEPIYNAIVWQDRRTVDYCRQLKAQGYADLISQKTGLCIDPYFSATKIVWLLENISGARERAERGELLAGTIDSFLVWRLTQGKTFITDITNAARTLLFNIHTQNWDQELLDLFNIPRALLAEVVDNAGELATIEKDLLGAPLLISGMAGDQQAAAISQACFKPGMVKCTYGTGAFVLVNTGEKALDTSDKVLTTIAYRFKNQMHYAIEGSIFNAGTVIKWLRDNLHLIAHASESAELARSVEDNAGVYFVPAFTGLGAPYWDPNARAAILGLQRDTSVAEIVRAGLESIAYQTKDLMLALQNEEALVWENLRVDGGMAANDWLLQFLADILMIPVARPSCIETSALGAAYLAGLGAGIYSSMAAIEKLWHCQQAFKPQMSPALAEGYYQAWQHAVIQVQT